MAMTSHPMASPVMSGRIELDCINRLVEIDAILEEDRDKMTISTKEVDLDLLVTLKNPTISKQKQIQIGLDTLTGMAFEHDRILTSNSIDLDFSR